MSDLVRVQGRRNSTWLRKGQTRLAPYTRELQLLADAGWVVLLDPPPTTIPPDRPESSVSLIIDPDSPIPGVYVCHCGKEYKTLTGFEKHSESHGEDA